VRVFLAGATGVIGRRLVPLLIDRGHAVTAMTRRPEGAALLRSLGAEPVVADALDREALFAVVGGDVVIHQLTDLREFDLAANARLRVDGTRNLVDAARGAGVRRIIAQSVAFAYEPGDEPAGEQVALDLDAAEPRRTTVHGVAALEAATRELPEWVVLRYGLLYGAGTWFAPGGARAGRVVADRDVASFVHADDAAEAAVQALEWPSGTVNVCDDEPAPGREWAGVLRRGRSSGAAARGPGAHAVGAWGRQLPRAPRARCTGCKRSTDSLPPVSESGRSTRHRRPLSSRSSPGFSPALCGRTARANGLATWRRSGCRPSSARLPAQARTPSTPLSPRW
jgi:nucleoside-diphosphate-sugar epimerase